MYAQDDSQQRAELRLAFLRHLPKRAESVARRGRRFCREGWDINGLSLLYHDVQRLAGASGRYGLVDISEKLHALETLLGEVLERQALPDAEITTHIATLLEALAPALPAESAVQPAAATAGPSRQGDAQRFEPAPAGYWRRWAPDAPAAETDVEADVASDRPSAKPAPAPEPEPQRPSLERVYLLTDGSATAAALAQRMETLGYELELLETGDELIEVISAVAPDAVVVTAGFQEQLEPIGAAMRATRQRIGGRLPLLAIADSDAVPVRLSARRAGVDALMVDPADVDTVVGRLRELLDAGSEAPFRVLIVEDDRSQGLFAESILRNAGMESQVVDDAFRVLDAMDEFKPDLVLMDLYMPECDGTELTALIREREEFLHTPIVFLSGESDQDKQFAALDAGGDDFLAKPIRPKHLISAVENRVRRARAVQQRSARRDPRDPVTGLYDRAFVLDRVNDALGVEEVSTRPGGVLFLDFDGAVQLRERLGLTALEQLLGEAGRLVVAALPDGAIAARFGDGGMLCVCPTLDDAGLEELAVELRQKIGGHAFHAADRPLRMRVSIGVCAFRFGFADATALLNVVERTTRDARASDRGVRVFAPPRRAEQAREEALVQLIRDAVQGDAFELLFQPIVALQGGEQAQYQTLVRLRDDAGRLHAAGEIVPLAERADLIVDVDRWVLTQAMRVLEQRRGEQRPVRLFVSQSPLTLRTEDQTDWLKSRIEARKLPGGTLILELRLDEVAPHIEAATAFCAALVPLGVQFCLSHFMAGPEGDAIIDRLPVDFVKLAPRYLTAEGAPELRDELRAVVDDAHRRGKEVIAQRVEDAQAAATLWMAGIDFIQGNLVQQAGRTLEFDFQAAVL